MPPARPSGWILRRKDHEGEADEAQKLPRPPRPRRGPRRRSRPRGRFTLDAVVQQKLVDKLGDDAKTIKVAVVEKKIVLVGEVKGRDTLEPPPRSPGASPA